MTFITAHDRPARTRWLLGMLLFIGSLLYAPVTRAEGASLKITPATGTYEVGSLVDISFVVDTGGQAINAVQADVLFPPDKLQVVNPVASTSFISLWVTAPTYSNTDGTLKFQGGIPNPGIKTSAGVISTVTFRIKSPGKATLRFAPTSRILLNNGEGTNILSASGTAEYTLKIPPPAGPIVSSPTHPDANVWFNNPNIQFQWDPVENATGYSYTLDQSQKSSPDDTIDTTSTSVSLKAEGDGVWFFHIRAKTDIWGGVTTYSVQIDTTPPAAFTPKFDKSTITIEDVPTLRFLTSDAASGIDHYELKQVNLSDASSQANTLFVESTSPVTISKLSAGKYEYIARAYDRAGNSSDGSTKLTVVAGGLPFYISVPFLRNAAVANGALIALGILALTLVVVLVLRRFRIRSTFRHDLSILERDARRKSEALQKELEDLRQAQELVNRDLAGVPMPDIGVTRPAPAAAPIKRYPSPAPDHPSRSALHQ